jgi:hypothetical protein
VQIDRCVQFHLRLLLLSCGVGSLPTLVPLGEAG